MSWLRREITFRANGLDAVAIVEAGLSGASDEIVRSFAIREGRILITLDGDFANVLRFPPDSTPGVVRLRLRQPTENAITLALKRMLRACAVHNLAGKLMIIDEDKIRIRTP